MRKAIFTLIILGILGALVYGYYTYALVALYDQETVKRTHFFLLKKPERGWTFYYNHMNRDEVEKEVAQLEYLRKPVPWHLDYKYVREHKIHRFELSTM